MNVKNLKIIIKNYISKYGEILQERNASRLWRTAAEFKTLADEAVNAAEEDFTVKLFKLCERSKAAIDGKFLQPMNSINDFAAKEPENVRRMLKSLLAADWDNMNLRQNKIDTFVEECNELQNRYYPHNIRYYMTIEKALAIISMYDPDCNYLYQESPAKLFAQCVEYEGNWGSGNDFDYAAYYRMCEELTEHIRSDQQLIFTSCGRYQREEGLHEDMNYHLLAYDIILCNAKYKLYDGIKFSSGTLEESRAFHRRQQEAVICFQKYRNAWENNLELTKGHMSYLSMIKPGIRISHIKMGEGIVETVEGDNAIISFGEEGNKKFNMLQSALNGFIRIEKDGFDEWKTGFETVLSRRTEIQSQLEAASKQLEGCISLPMGL